MTGGLIKEAELSSMPRDQISLVLIKWVGSIPPFGVIAARDTNTTVDCTTQGREERRDGMSVDEDLPLRLPDSPVPRAIRNPFPGPEESDGLNGPCR